MAESIEPSAADGNLATPPNPGAFDRLSTPFPLRLPLLTFVSGTAGMCLGLIHGSQESSLRFRAENAHRLPTSQTGWYLYHKSKNYHVILGGVKEGFKMSARMGWWAGLFVLMEEGVDRGRAAAVRAWKGHAPSRKHEVVDPQGEVSRDFLSTLFAGLGAAGAFSAWNRLPLPTAVRLAKTGAKGGLAFGLLQDGVSLMRGRRLGYVEFIKRHTIGESEEELPAEGKVTAGAG